MLQYSNYKLKRKGSHAFFLVTENTWPKYIYYGGCGRALRDSGRCAAERSSVHVLQCRLYTQSCCTVVQSLCRRRGFVVVATRVAVNHGVNHQNKIGELQHTSRRCILKLKKNNNFINQLCACSVWLSPRVHKFPQILGARTDMQYHTEGPRMYRTRFSRSRPQFMYPSASYSEVQGYHDGEHHD